MTALSGLAHGRRRPAGRNDVLWVSLLWTALAVWVLAVALSPAQLTVVHQDLGELARNLASGTLLVAGVLCLATWRLTADPVVARRSIALLVLGASYPAAAAIGPLLGDADGLVHAAPSTRALFVVPIVALLLPGTDWRRQTQVRPIPIAYLVATGWAVGLVLGVALFARHALAADSLAVGSRLICCLTLFAWLLLAYRSAVGARPDQRSSARSMATAFVLLALAEGFRLFAVEGQSAVLGIAPGIQLAAALVFVMATGDDLVTARRGEEESSAELVRAVAELEAQVAAVGQAQRERLHDARSAMLGVIGASELLGGSALPVDEAQLRRLITAELRRLHGVLDGGAAEPVREFDLAEALEPVVLSHLLEGQALQADLVGQPGRSGPGARPGAVGRSGPTATVIDNLLRNAQRHAPGSTVTVQVHAWGDTVSVVVEDDGPGIPADERAAVLRPGVRGSTARGPGEGLGLHSCVATMQSQGGSLRLDEGERGGTRVTVTLPRATAAVPALPRGA